MEETQIQSEIERETGVREREKKEERERKKGEKRTKSRLDVRE